MSDDNTVGRPEETTQVLVEDEQEWPVADLYRVEPDAPPEDAPAQETVLVATVEETAPAAGRRRLPPLPGPGLGVAIAAALVLIALGAWLVSRDGEDDPDTPPVVETSTQPATRTTSSETTTTPSRRPVPDVSGRTLEEARKVLEDSGLRVRVVRRDSPRPAGEVLRQVPKAGASLAQGQAVVLTVARAAGPDGVDVATPELVGLALSDASTMLRDARLRAEIELVASDEAAGTVVRQVPDPGTELAEGSLVRLEVAKAKQPEVERVDLPDLVGTDVSAARAQLRELGLRVSVVRVVGSEPAGTVIRQSPRPGASVREGSTVTLRVSTGPAEVDVPDVVGLDEISARQHLEDAGFTVRTTEQSTDDPAEDGLVVAQSPTGGSTVREGGVVTITVARVG